MTSQTTRNEPRPAEPGYRGALPSRDDRLARPWLLAVFGIFVLIFVLAFLGVPSRLFPEPTVAPLPSVPVPSGLASQSVSPEASPSGGIGRFGGDRRIDQPNVGLAGSPGR